MRVDTKDIDDIINRLNNLSSNINKLKTDLPRAIGEEGLSYLNSLYASKPKENDTDDITTSIKDYDNGCYIIAKGKDVLYEEFGTGDEGEKNPHPERLDGLKGYNTGPTIRNVNPDNPALKSRGITSGKYWTYEKNGEIVYTQGIPSGKQMYNTSRYLKKGVIKKIMKEKASDVLSKV